MAELETIPVITDPMGQGWVQPSLDEIAIDDTHALMTAETMARLADYSCSMPSGVYPGKMWRRRRNYHDESAGWWLCWYGYDPNPRFCSNHYREILIAEEIDDA